MHIYASEVEAARAEQGLEHWTIAPSGEYEARNSIGEVCLTGNLLAYREGVDARPKE